MTEPQTQNLKTFLLCPCGEKATIGYAFPGAPERGICDLHEKSVEFRRELSPGRAEVASVRRLDGPAPSNVMVPPELRDLNWERSQVDDLKTQLAEKDEELQTTREQLAEAHAALTQAGLDHTIGKPET